MVDFYINCFPMKRIIAYISFILNRCIMKRWILISNYYYCKQIGIEKAISFSFHFSIEVLYYVTFLKEKLNNQMNQNWEVK